MKTLIFRIYFLNMDISLVMRNICLKTVDKFLRPIWREGCLKILIKVLASILQDVEEEKHTKDLKSYLFFALVKKI